MIYWIAELAKMFQSTVKPKWGQIQNWQLWLLTPNSKLRICFIQSSAWFYSYKLNLVSSHSYVYQVQKELGCRKNPLAFDIRAACSGFVLGLMTAGFSIRGNLFFASVLEHYSVSSYWYLFMNWTLLLKSQLVAFRMF